MIRQINFDMDGTIANLYGVDGWLAMLQASDTTPYAIAKPMVNMNSLARILNRLHRQGYRITVISWLSKTGTKEYNDAVARVKKEWLDKHLASVQWDEIHIVPYGTPKETLGTGILFDDEEKNRNNWNGVAYDVVDIIETLKAL